MISYDSFVVDVSRFFEEAGRSSANNTTSIGPLRP
jgi:hypothetical protein